MGVTQIKINMVGGVTEWLHDKLNIALKEYVIVFCNKHDVEFNGWIGKPGEIADIDGIFIDFRDIRTDLETNQPVDIFLKWHDYAIGMQAIGRAVPNYESWISGYKDVV